MSESPSQNDFIGVAHVGARDGELILTLPPELCVLGDLRAGDTAVFSELPRGQWLIHFRRDRRKVKIPALPKKCLYFPPEAARAAEAKLEKLFAKFTAAKTEKARARWRQQYLAVRYEK